MPIGSVHSNTSLVGTLVFDSESLNNTGISNRRISPINFSALDPGTRLAPVQKKPSIESNPISSFKSGLTSSKIATLDQVDKIIHKISLSADSSQGAAPSSLPAKADQGGLQLAPPYQTYNSIGKLTSDESLVESGTQLNLVA